MASKWVFIRGGGFKSPTPNQCQWPLGRVKELVSYGLSEHPSEVSVKVMCVGVG